jgi:O-antigen/teichoic acid export membrane protein
MVGIYAALANIGATGMSAVTTVFAQLYTPQIYSTSGAYTRTYIRRGLTAVAVVLALSLAASPFLVATLARPDLAPYRWLVSFGVLTEGGNFLINAFAVALSISGRTAPILRNGAIGCLLSIGVLGALILLRQASAATIGIPIALSQIVIFCLMARDWKREAATG